MTNPWLEISPNDYESHMASPEVRQLQALNKIFRNCLTKLKPKSVAILGCCTGNGFEHIDPSITERVVGIDINPKFLSITMDRFSFSIPNLELLEFDISNDELEIQPVDLVFGALIFEYVDIEKGRANIRKILKPGGHFVACLQMPSESCSVVTPTPYKSLEKLTQICH
ncbi:MAG: class I SAM-dependent methyltransferase [Bacteroidetes bacterium]|nr:class I SAM-dependent methyltransferase [Bacteroidota bacterium]